MRIDKSLCLVITLVLLVGLNVTGCGKKAPETTAAPATQGLGPEESLETGESPIMEGRTSAPMLPVYFGFDKSAIVGDQVQRIEANAEFLKKNPDVQIRIEGNTDSRGTLEYNLALGERRAQSAKTYLMNLGVGEERINTISWGEEKLLLFGHDEISWAQNRRDDFVIIK